MASHEQNLPGPKRPQTPGLHLGRSSPPPPYQNYTRTSTSESPTRLASLDLTSTRNTYDTYDDWTELQELSTTKRADSDTQKLLDPSVRRSSISSSVSSDSTIVRQSRPVRWLNSIGDSTEAFCRLPVIRHIIWPFQWLDLAMLRLTNKTRFRGWRMGIIIGSLMSSLILGANFAGLSIGATRGKGFENGFAVPTSGMADEISWWSSAIHIAVNALSTILLAVSNYTMQVLSSPTREDIDKAHAKHEHLDIGVLSVRNLTRIPRRRLLLFLLMGLSSIPIHLFYNSAVFYIGANNEYDIHAVQVGSDDYYKIYDRSKAPRRAESNQTNIYNDGGPVYDMLSGDQWVKAYDTALVSYGMLYLAIEDYRSEIDNDTLTGYPKDYPNVATEVANSWAKGKVDWTLQSPLKQERSSPDLVRAITRTGASSKEWIQMETWYRQLTSNTLTPNPPKFAHVPHVFAQRLDTASRIQLSLTFLVIVIVCNSMKLLTMLWVVFMEQKDYIVTLGDGAASFLERPDPTTERMCILSKPAIIHEVSEAPFKGRHDDHLSRLITRSGRGWTKQSTTYSSALNKDRELGSQFMFIVIGILFVAFIPTAILMGSPKWGTSSITTFREAGSSPQQTLLNAWIANAGQLVLSFCYLAINSECTAMASAAEWNSLASSRKGLRVTRPVGQQRDTYFLQLPYRWSLPLTIMSGGFHWLLSQSIFLVRIDTYDRSGNLIPDQSKSACGFSGISWIALSISFLILVGMVGLIGHRKYKVNIPFAASCSLVISAACHAPPNDPDPHLKPLKWGVVEQSMYEGEMHCSLSARKVTKPKVGKTYL